MLSMYIKEFIAICTHLEAESYPVKNGFIRIKRETLDALLNKNQYEIAQNKLKTWKALNWISTDERGLTKKIYDGETKKYYPHVLISLTVYQTLRELTGTKPVAY